MRCPKCNAQVEKDDVFCPECGSRLDYVKKSNFPVVMISLAVLIIISVGIVGWLITGNPESTDRYDSSYVEAEEKNESNSQKKDDTTAKGTEETGIGKSEKMEEPEENASQNSGNTEQSKDAGYSESDYILPESNTRYLTEADIKGLSIQYLNYAKKEIYARHGRKFDSNELQTYFNSKSWYQGIYEPADFDANYNPKVLSDIEKKNAEFLKNAEYKISSSGYQLDK